MNQFVCPSCNHILKIADKFCPGCGTRVSSENPESENRTKTIVSSGKYSGTMIKSKASFGWKIFRNVIIATVVLGVLALAIWFQFDPDAGKKLTDALMGIGFMAVFFFTGWLFMRGQKGKKRSNWDDDQYSDVCDDND